jgi:hypothetical protein
MRHMDVQIGSSRFAPVPDELEPLVRAYAALQGRSVIRAPSGVLEVSDGRPVWTSPRAQALLNAYMRE